MVTSLVRSGFGAAARLRRGRPLHPAGLVLDARLRVHGTGRVWGAEFLDRRMDLEGIARFSRSTGVPPPLPDILGIALRWEQSDLLLASTGHTVLGRRLLRPARAWAPGLYSSLFSYEVGGRRVLIGALPRAGRRLPARFDALARAVADGPLLLDLLVAAPAGPWEVFGQVEVAGPARTDAERPTRFDPVRRPVPGMRQAGWLSEVREAAYSGAQQVADQSHEERV
ncbi:hypothetical protein ACBI99_13970 [Nonomuraea sp. ATR24]|uniref:hypothetical protein n=1 Tax=Nonomuraea TaxID=83681 RepID=UPI001C5D25AA|nr:hypothetical protein [Nonomuraea ceibae]